jgi:hypothetical protein
MTRLLRGGLTVPPGDRATSRPLEEDETDGGAGTVSGRRASWPQSGVPCSIAEQAKAALRSGRTVFAPETGSQTRATRDHHARKCWRAFVGPIAITASSMTIANVASWKSVL